MNKKMCVVLFFVMCAFLLSSQESKDSTETINLPDVQTELEGSNPGIEDSAIPDFSLIVPSIAFSDELFIANDEPLENGADENLPVDEGNQNKKEIFLQGLVGAGWPARFYGDFSIQKHKKKDPFSLTFNAQSLHGYQSHFSSQGFNATALFIDGKKTFSFDEIFMLTMHGFYKTTTDGLQGKSLLFSTMSKHLLKGGADFMWQATPSFSVGARLFTEFNSRFAGFKSTLPQGVPTGAQHFGLSPTVLLSFTRGAFSLDFSGKYDFSTYSSSINALLLNNRGCFDLQASYLFSDYFSSQAGVSLVITTTSKSVVVPFFVKGSFIHPLFSCTLEGGLKSFPTDIAKLEKLYPFTHFEKAKTEESFWYATTDVFVPFLERYAIKADATFLYTALGNKRMLPSLTSVNAQTNLNNVTLKEWLSFDTSLAFSFNLDNFGLEAGWKAAFFDKEDASYAQSIFVSCSFFDTQGKMGAELVAKQSFLPFLYPLLSVSGFYRLTSELELSIEANNIVNFVTGTDTLLFNRWVKDGGSIGLFMKLYL